MVLLLVVFFAVVIGGNIYVGEECRTGAKKDC
jgi:hypothetical protein